MRCSICPSSIHPPTTVTSKRGSCRSVAKKGSSSPSSGPSLVNPERKATDESIKSALGRMGWSLPYGLKWLIHNFQMRIFPLLALFLPKMFPKCLHLINPQIFANLKTFFLRIHNKFTNSLQFLLLITNLRASFIVFIFFFIHSFSTHLRPSSPPHRCVLQPPDQPNPPPNNQPATTFPPPPFSSNRSSSTAILLFPEHSPQSALYFLIFIHSPSSILFAFATPQNVTEKRQSQNIFAFIIISQ